MRPRHLLPPPLRASLFNGCTSVPVQVFASGERGFALLVVPADGSEPSALSCPGRGAPPIYRVLTRGAWPSPHPPDLRGSSPEPEGGIKAKAGPRRQAVAGAGGALITPGEAPRVRHGLGHNKPPKPAPPESTVSLEEGLRLGWIPDHAVGKSPPVPSRGGEQKQRAGSCGREIPQDLPSSLPLNLSPQVGPSPCASAEHRAQPPHQRPERLVKAPASEPSSQKLREGRTRVSGSFFTTSPAPRTARLHCGTEHTTAAPSFAASLISSTRRKRS